MAKYIYKHTKPLWFVNHGKSKILNNDELIKPDDIDYIKQTYPGRILCIEEDIKESDNLLELKSLVATQSNQIQELINVLKSTAGNTQVIIKSIDSSNVLPESENSIKIKEPDFRPSSALDINSDDITVVGSAGDSVTSTSGIDISEKLKKLSRLKKKNCVD